MCEKYNRLADRVLSFKKILIPFSCLAVLFLVFEKYRKYELKFRYIMRTIYYFFAAAMIIFYAIFNLFLLLPQSVRNSGIVTIIFVYFIFTLESFILREADRYSMKKALESLTKDNES